MTFTITLIGTYNSGASLVSSYSITAPVVPAGAIIFGFTFVGATANSTTVGQPTDTAGNTYVNYNSTNANNLLADGTLSNFYTTTGLPLSSGNALSSSWNAGFTGIVRAAFFYMTGAAFPLGGEQDSGHGSSTSPTTNIFSTSSGQISITACAWLGNSTFTQDSSHAWSNLPSGTVSDANAGLAGGYLVQGATQVTSYAPTLGTSLPWAANVISFNAGVPCSNSLSLLGVGCGLRMIGSPIPILGGAALRRWGPLRGKRTVSRREVLIGHNGGPPLDD